MNNPITTDQIAALGIAPPMPLKGCSRVNNTPADPASYGSNSPFTRSGTYSAECALSRLAELRAADVKDHNANIPAIEHNKRVRDAITMVMGAAGVPLTYREQDPRSRSRFPKAIVRDAGYLGDLRRFFPTDDGFSASTAVYERLLTRFTEYADKMRAEEDRKRNEQANAAAALKAKREADMKLAAILLRYNLPPDAEDYMIRSAIRDACRYVDLAEGMLAVRCDWNDGCGAAQDALDRFLSKMNKADPRDIEIANDVLGSVASFNDCHDGRVFRDARWGYDAIFEIADQQVRADAEFMRSRSET